MSKDIQKKFLLVLLLTVMVGMAVFFTAKYVDRNISEATTLKNQAEKETRVASDKKTQIEQNNLVEEYKTKLDKNLARSDDIITILEQLEIIGQLTNVAVKIKLEEGVIGQEGIQFKDITEKQEFLNTLEVKEYTQEEASKDSSSQNVVLQLMQQQQGQTPATIKISFLEIDLALKGTYFDLRAYVNLVQNSHYFFNIKELRFNKIDDSSVLDCNLQMRAFIFE